MATKQDIHGIIAEVWRIVDGAQAMGWTDAVTQSALGAIKNYMEQVDVLLDALEPDAPPPPPPEPAPPAGLLGVYGTYPGHGLAQDLYGGTTPDEVAWGPHHGLPLVAPADGRVEVYQFGTPLAQQRLKARGVADLAVYAVNWEALNAGWTCWVSAQQTMFVAVWWPKSSYFEIGGQQIGHLHYGHVRSDIKAGPVLKGERFATVHDSGIRFEPGVPNARAAHTHCVAGAGTTLSPNGDLPGRLAVVAQGWQVTPLASVPGPTDYQSGRFCAGRLLRDFTEGGHPIPPIPS